MSMEGRLRHFMDVWDSKWRYSNWNFVPVGLDVYCLFCGCYGFRMHGGFGWERVHTLDFATKLQDTRKHGCNWKSLWKHRQYSK